MRVFTWPGCRLALAAVLALFASLGPAFAQPAQCGRFANGSGGAATTAVVVGAAGSFVHVCGWDVTATAAGTFQLIQGTGATCGTGTTTITAAHSMTGTNTIVSWGNPGKVSLTPGNGLCVVITGTGPVQWTVYYAVFF